MLRKYFLTLVNNGKGLRIFKIFDGNEFGIIIEISLQRVWSKVCGTGYLIVGSLGCWLQRFKHIGQLFIISTILLLVSGQNRT